MGFLGFWEVEIEVGIEVGIKVEGRVEEGVGVRVSYLIYVCMCVYIFE